MDFVDALFICFISALFIAGVVFFIAGLRSIRKRKKWLNQCKIVKGKVVDLKKIQVQTMTDEGWAMEARNIPVVEFSPSERPNEVITFEGKDRMECYLLIGQSIHVRYKKENVHEADIEDFASNWGNAAWAFLFSFLGLGMGVYSLVIFVNG